MTVVARTFASIPARSAAETWEAIVALLASDPTSDARSHLGAVAGVVCSLIADEALREDALVVFGGGPRVRVYCLYGDAAVEGDDARENPLGFAATEGDWQVSVPCRVEDLEWVSRALVDRSIRVQARALGTEVDSQEHSGTSSVDPIRRVPRIDRNSLRRG